MAAPGISYGEKDLGVVAGASSASSETMGSEESFPASSAHAEDAQELKLLRDAIAVMTSKGVLSKDPPRREMEFGRLLDATMVPEALRASYTAARARAIRLVAPVCGIGGIAPLALESTPAGVHPWSEDEFPGFAVVMINDAATRVQRTQHSGLCYMHAGAVVQYYAICHATRAVGHKMLDLARDIQTRFDAEALYKHVFNDNGGSSLLYLRSILHPGSNLQPRSIDQFGEMLTSHGPALVAQFAVHDDFAVMGVHKHHGAPSGLFHGYHAMVLVGVRQEGARMFLLLQNWWKSKQFVEVCADYFVACGATAYFVETPQLCVPGCLATICGHYFESHDLLDKPESVMWEDLRLSS